MSFTSLENLASSVASDIAGALGFAVQGGSSAIGPNPVRGVGGVGLLSNQGLAIASAANKYGVPAQILAGVYGMETNFGQDVKTSSAGAVGPFQFLPSTASQYGYPLTNTPNASQFHQQADAAAQYLASLYKSTGSWDSALRDYSGGGYGLSQVEAKAGQAPSDLLSSLFGHAQPYYAVQQAGGAAVDWVPQTIQDAINGLIGDAKYAGMFLVLIAVAGFLIVHGLTGHPPTTIIMREGPHGE